MGAQTLYDAILTPPIASSGIPVPESVTSLRCTGNGTSFASTPDHADLDITGDLFIAVRVSLNSWTSVNSQTLVSKWTGAASGCSYELEVRPTGELMLNHSTDGTATKSDISTVTLPSVGFVAGRTYWVAAMLDVDNGAGGRSAKFYWAYDSEVMPNFLSQNYWQQLGTTVTTAGTTSIFNSTTSLLVGQLTSGSIYYATGNFYNVYIRNTASFFNSVAGGTTTRLDIDFSTQTAGATSFTENTGKTVTVNSPATLTSADAGWRFAVEILIASRGSKVDYAKVDTAKVDDYSWFDLTGYVQGVEWTRGNSLGSAGYPNANAGVLNLTLHNPNNFFSSWNTSLGTVSAPGGISTANLNREWTANRLIRVCFYKVTAGATYTQNTTTGLTSVTRWDWAPRFCGFVESWNESIELNRSVVSVTAVETIAALASKTNAAGTLSAGDGLALRLYHLLIGSGTPTAQSIVNGSDNWRLPIYDPVTFYTSSDGLVSYTQLQARSSIASNLKAEADLSALSIAANRIESHPDGSLRIACFGPLSFPAAPNPPTSAQPTYLWSPVIRFTSAARKLATDSTNWSGTLIDAYYASPLQLSENSDTVLNYLSMQNVGGSAQTYYTSSSTGLYGKRGLSRTDLIATVTAGGISVPSTVTGSASPSDIAAAQVALTLLGELDGWQNLAAGNVNVSQSMQPGAVTIENQFKAQRYLDIGNFGLLDWYGQPTPSATPAFRCIGRVVQTKDSIIRIQGGIKWTTTAQLITRFNYQPT